MKTIGENTHVPLVWFIGGIISTWGIVGTCAYWASGVNGRLARIENKLGIGPYVDSGSVIPSAMAGQHDVKTGEK